MKTKMKKHMKSSVNKLVVAVSLALVSGVATSATTVFAPNVDNGYFNTRINEATGEPAQSLRFVSGNGSGEYRMGLTGAQFGRFGPFTFSNNLRSYQIFNLPALTGTEYVSAATFRWWGMAQNGQDIIAGVYRSEHDSETVSLFSVDHHTPADIMNAPFDLTPIGGDDVDLPIWEDFGDGDIFATRVYTQADEENPGLIPNPHPLSTTTDCSNPLAGNEACGRWIDFELTAEALTDINANLGSDWIFGIAVTSITQGTIGLAQQVHSATQIDLGNPRFENFISPEAQLELTVVPVPAAVWLFGSGLLGLVAIARRRKALTV